MWCSSSFSSQSLFRHFADFLHWLELDASVDSWQRWHLATTNARHTSCLRQLQTYLTRTAPISMILVVSSMAAIEVSETFPVTLAFQRELLCASLAIGAIISAFVLFFVADSGSTRRLVKVATARNPRCFQPLLSTRLYEVCSDACRASGLASSFCGAFV